MAWTQAAASTNVLTFIWCQTVQSMSKNWMKLEMRRYVHENNVWLSKGFYMHCSFGRRGRCLADVADGQVDARTSTNDQSLSVVMVEILSRRSIIGSKLSSSIGNIDTSAIPSWTNPINPEHCDLRQSPLIWLFTNDTLT